ncbi:hypothetical protein GCM10022280_13780 [Sphingomonas swuensis]|uniref:Uncharacterized protein n=1 Tax=Sphingomonas swuensis TaxID=977800 RepID=A0ABP7SU98_9SPHN
MDKPTLSPTDPKLTTRTSLAEEQRLAFDEDRARRRRPLLSLRFPGAFLRN